MRHRPGIYERLIPEGAELSTLGIDVGNLTTLGGISLVGGGMWGDTPPPEPVGAVILIPLTMDGEELGPLAVVQSAKRLRELRDQFVRVFDKAADAAEEMFANNGELKGKQDETPQT